MHSTKREFYDVEEAANVLGISVADVWHLIEVEKIGASFRKAIVDNTFLYDTFELDEAISLFARHTFLIPSNVASIIVAKGSSIITAAYLQLLEPREVSIVEMHGNGEECVVLSDAHELQFNEEITIQKSDVVITQVSIEKYLQSSGNSNGSTLGEKKPQIDKINNHVSNYLAILNQASSKFWANADPKDSDTHPLNTEVAAWLVQRDFSSTLADKGATIIRPEWATTGRKPDK